MSAYSQKRLIRILLIASFTLFACNAVSGSSGDTVPTPTLVAVQVTDPAPQPTAIIQPTEALEPTQSSSNNDQPNVNSNGIDILQVNSYLDGFDTWHVVGLLQNNTGSFVDNIEVEVEFYDENGNSIFLDSAFPDIYYLASGEISTFDYYVYEEMPNAFSYEVRVIGNTEYEVDRALADVVNSRITIDDYGDVHITGEVFNSTDRPIKINSLAAATFDADGLIQSAGSYSASIRYLDPGDVGPFRVTMSGRGDLQEMLEAYEVYVDAEFTDPIIPFDISISDAIYYLDTFDDLHLVGEMMNGEDVALNIELIAGIYDSSGIVLDAATTILPFSTVAPGESVPYDFEYWGAMDFSGNLLDLADSYTIQVDAYWTWESTVELVELSSQNEVNEFDEFGGEFSGQVSNNSDGPVSYITVLIYLVDIETGQVVATDYDFIVDEIPAGGVADYKVYLNVYEAFDINTAEYFVIVKGERP